MNYSSADGCSFCGLVGWQAELGINDEFTRPGLIYMLEKFKSKVEDIEQDEDEEITFVFQ